LTFKKFGVNITPEEPPQHCTS